MREILVALACVIATCSGSRASTVIEMTIGTPYEIIGGSSSNPVAFGTASFTFTGGDLPPTPDTNPYSGFLLIVHIGTATLEACNSNQPGAMCGRYLQQFPLVVLDYPSSTIIASFGVEEFGTVSPINVSAFLTLPDGFSVADAVPEPSTWAMLLIGFAGIGFAGYRKRSSEKCHC